MCVSISINYGVTTSIDLVRLVYNSCFLLILVSIECLINVRLKKTGRSPLCYMLERLRKHEPMCTRFYWLYLMHE